MTPDQIKAAVGAIIAENRQKLAEERYHCNLSILLGQITRSLKWADGAAVRAVLEAEVEALLGPKTEADLKPPEKKPKVKAPPKVNRVLVCTAMAKGYQDEAESEDIYALCQTLPHALRVRKFQGPW